MRHTLLPLVLAGGLMCSATASAVDVEWELGVETRIFTQTPDSSNHDDVTGSVFIQPEIYHRWNDGLDSFSFVPYLRWDSADDERTHGDIRELEWIHLFDTSELRVGVRKVFWGVTESQHLVDIINQSDQVDNLDAEDKLGQPMINMSWSKDWGVLDVFVLTGFRERTFPGKDGRFRLPIDLDNVTYESSEEDKHIDLAIRWSQIYGDFEIAVSHFEGTSREAVLIPTTMLPPPVFRLYYPQISQTGLELQYVMDGFLWKLEAISRDGFGISGISDDRYAAATFGFEYTQGGVFDTSTDLGWILEYSVDERDSKTTGFLNNDVFFGTRWAMNDAASSEVLAGVIWDPESEDRMWSVEASRRVGENWKASMEARVVEPAATTSRLYPFDRDDLVQIEVLRYF